MNMEIKRFIINPNEIKKGAQKGRPFIQIKREDDQAIISISDGEIGLVAFLSPRETYYMTQGVMLQGSWEAGIN